MCGVFWLTPCRPVSFWGILLLKFWCAKPHSCLVLYCPFFILWLALVANKETTIIIWLKLSAYFVGHDVQCQMSTANRLKEHLFIYHFSRTLRKTLSVPTNEEFCRCSIFGFVPFFLSHVISWVLILPGITSILFITHNLHVLTSNCHRCSVLLLFDPVVTETCYVDCDTSFIYLFTYFLFCSLQRQGSSIWSDGHTEL